MRVYINNSSYCPLLYNTRNHNLPFHLEKDKFTLVNEISEADVIPVMASDPQVHFIQEKINFIKDQYRGQLIIIMLHTHMSDGDGEEFHLTVKKDWFPFTKNVTVVHTNKKVKANIFNDFYWNRQKAYFIDYDKFDLVGRLWTTCTTKKAFALDEIKLINPQKKFLVPNRIHKGVAREIPRTRLLNFCQEDDCYYSDFDNDKYILPEEYNITLKEMYFDQGYCPWLPIANSYYQSSFVSAYTETITVDDLVDCITEKTYNPLLKGHFILPFGYHGMIETIKNYYGFKLPDWIDYSYDAIKDDQQRLESWVISLEKIRNMSIEQLTDLWHKDKHILEYNRSIFFTRPYDSLYEKIVQFTNFYK